MTPSRGIRRFKVGLGASIEMIDALVERWQDDGHTVEVHCCTRGLYAPIRPERKGWGGADVDPHIGPAGQRYGRD